MNQDVTSFFATPKVKKKPVIPKREEIKGTPRVLKPSNSRKKEQEPEVRNSFGILKTYPERKYDKFQHKNARLRGDDLDLISILCREIAHGRSHLPVDERPQGRITENTIIRELLSFFCNQLEEKQDIVDYNRLQTEDEIKSFIRDIVSH
jgi:hypothetical protein